LHVPDPQSDRDALIAATALEYGMIVVTRNVSDFELPGVEIIDPWVSETGDMKPGTDHGFGHGRNRGK
jgi:hypothetical protein